MSERAKLLCILAAGLITGTISILFGIRSEIRLPYGQGWDFIWMGLGMNALMVALWLWLRKRAK